jgi:methanogenic corrinoid protein MtbC1
MSPIISPRELAEAIGVSESSLKRWADDGQIHVSRTGGGHRRIAIGEAIRFVRAIRAPLVKPELLGLRDLSSDTAAILAPESPAERLFAHLRDGRARESRALVLSLYLQGQGVADIADGPIQIAMERLGELWKHDQAGIYIEHRATDICIQAVEQLRLLVEPQQSHTIALGGAPPRDPYLLASLLVATALAAEGWHALNLGADTPFDALLRAMEVHSPRLVWVSISSIGDMSEVDRGICVLAQRLSERNATLALGGRALPTMTGLTWPNVHCCQTVAELIKVAKTLGGDAPPDSQGAHSTQPGAR